MRVLLKRQLFAAGTRFRPNPSGVDVPDDIRLPRDAKVWDGKSFVDQPDDDKKREALVAKATKAPPIEEEEVPMVTSYDPRYKNPNSPEPIVGKEAPEVVEAPAKKK